MSYSNHRLWFYFIFLFGLIFILPVQAQNKNQYGVQLQGGGFGVQAQSGGQFGVQAQGNGMGAQASRGGNNGYNNANNSNINNNANNNNGFSQMQQPNLGGLDGANGNRQRSNNDNYSASHTTTTVIGTPMIMIDPKNTWRNPMLEPQNNAENDDPMDYLERGDVLIPKVSSVPLYKQSNERSGVLARLSLQDAAIFTGQENDRFFQVKTGKHTGWIEKIMVEMRSTR